MTVFDQNMIALGLPALMAQFGERVVYRPHQGKPRTIWAMVERDSPVPPSGADSPAYKFIVTVIADMQADTYGGIELTEIDRGVDKIELEPIRGRAASSRTIGEVLECDCGALVLGVH